MKERKEKKNRNKTNIKVKKKTKTNGTLTHVCITYTHILTDNTLERAVSATSSLQISKTKHKKKTKHKN